MKNCWKILDIEETTDVDIIRRAYLALLPSFHPETDPGNDSNLLIVFYVQIMPD
ncbi:J domain-containing protein, partial [Escherichia coli]|uniref:J domain-containing protein n=1 Tax=Escherichia coli TaxID=562 RepID=UPI0013B46998